MEFAQRASALVADASAGDVTSTEVGAAHVGVGAITGSRTAQSCVLAVRQNWQWLQELLRCSEIHLTHAAEYHQVYM